MKIYLHEITDQETELEFNQDEPWVLNAVCRVDENSEASLQPKKTRPVTTSFSLRQVDSVVVISGKISTHIDLLCSRCANSFHHSCKIQFSGLFCKDPVMAGVAHLQRQPESRDRGRPMGQNQGFARHAHNSDEDEAVLSGQDLDITYLSNDWIDLGDVMTEQLQLQVPFQPLCAESCKGMCTHCGTDLNRGRCACAKIKSDHPFSALRDLKL
jgi:uncharacterized protein